jgi:large subunit ribosomal protein L29
MKASDLREKTQNELEQELAALKSELFKLRFQFATNQLDNPMKLKDVRKSIARVKTIIREREIIDGNAAKAGKAVARTGTEA